MRKYILFLIAAVALAIPATAAAWHPVVGGLAVCDESKGVFAITWTVGNSEAGDTMRYTSDRAAVGSGDIAGGGSKTFSESLPGNTTGTVTLNVSGSWDNHEQGVQGSATVGLEGNCKAPTPPPPHQACPDGGPPNAGKDGQPGNDACARGKTVTPTTTTTSTVPTTTTETTTTTTMTTATAAVAAPATAPSSSPTSGTPKRSERPAAVLGTSASARPEQLAFTP